METPLTGMGTGGTAPLGPPAPNNPTGQPPPVTSPTGANPPAEATTDDLLQLAMYDQHDSPANMVDFTGLA